MWDGNSRGGPASPQMMKNEDDIRTSGTADAESRALWVVMAAGLFLLAAAALSGESGPTLSRTDRFQATLAPGGTVRVENVNGDVVASRGAACLAVVTTTVTAPNRTRAQEILDRTRVLQSIEGADYELKTDWPDSGGHRRGHSICRDCRIVSRYELTIPAGISAALQTVNGEVRVKDVDGNLEVQSVNGNVQVAGAQRSVQAQTVNGRVEAIAAALPEGASWNLQTVNGGVVATLPKSAKFDWSASTLGGSISTTFALPAGREDAAATPPPPPPPPSRTKHTRVVVSPDEIDEEAVDPAELAREVEESLRAAEIETRQEERGGQRIHVMLPERRYSAKVGGGGPAVR